MKKTVLSRSVCLKQSSLSFYPYWGNIHSISSVNMVPNKLRYSIFQCSNMSKMFRSMQEKRGEWLKWKQTWMLFQPLHQLTIEPIQIQHHTGFAQAPIFSFFFLQISPGIGCSFAQVLKGLASIAHQEAPCEIINTSSAVLVLTFTRSCAKAQPNVTTVYLFVNLC